MSYLPTSKRRPDRIVWQRDDYKTFRLTPALQNAGYYVPLEVLIREGFMQKRTRQVIEERAAHEAEVIRQHEKRQANAIEIMAQPWTVDGKQTVVPPANTPDPAPHQAPLWGNQPLQNR